MFHFYRVPGLERSIQLQQTLSSLIPPDVLVESDEKSHCGRVFLSVLFLSARCSTPIILGLEETAFLVHHILSPGTGLR